MSRGLLGRKVGMTQVFDSRGIVVPVTVVAAGPCVVLRLRTKERDGYAAAQLGFEDKPRRLSSRAERGMVAVLDAARPGKVERPNCEPKRFIREFRDAPEYTVGRFEFDGSSNVSEIFDQNSGQNSKAFVARLLPDGNPDTTFSGFAQDIAVYTTFIRLK